MNGLDWLLIGLGFAFVAFAVISDGISRADDACRVDRSFTAEDPACKAVADLQIAARERMERDGIKTLLTGRRAWQTIRTMDTEKPATVLPMRRKR